MAYLLHRADQHGDLSKMNIYIKKLLEALLLEFVILMNVQN